MFIALAGQTDGEDDDGGEGGRDGRRGRAVRPCRAAREPLVLTIVPLGIGFLPALLTDDRRALHDRLPIRGVMRGDE